MWSICACRLVETLRVDVLVSDTQPLSMLRTNIFLPFVGVSV